MRRTSLLVAVILALAATMLSATAVGAREGTGKSIYVTARWSDYYKRIEAAGFELGCDLYLLPSAHEDLSAVADRIVSLDPATDALLIINDGGEGHFDSVATRVDQFVSAGGRAVWLFVFYYTSDNSLNDVLRDRFGVMADYHYLFSGQATYEGETLSPLWDGLMVGLPGAVNQGLANNIVVRDRNAVQSTLQSPEGEIITSAHVQKGAGEILFIAVPSFHYGGSFEADKGIFADDAIALYDNAEALNRVCQWLSGADVGSPADGGKSTPADALSGSTLFTTPAFARPEHVACGPNDTYFVLTFGGADDVMPLGAASVTVAALNSDTTLDIIPLDDINRGIDYQGLIIDIGTEILEAGPPGIAANLLREIEAAVERQSRPGIQQFRVWSPTNRFDPHLRFLIWASHPAGGGVSITSEWHPNASEFPAQEGSSLPAPLAIYPCGQ